ncbi:hypothetical protein BUY46_01845 [Staphylococcus devriesei]|nr:hypothetical protein BUY46_01845 [Staphylococcus devriesei]
MSKSNKELATELMIAILEHNSKLTTHGPQGTVVSKVNMVDSKIVASHLKYLKGALDSMDN